MKLTKKQKFILKTISTREKPFDIDLDELLDEVPYSVTKDSIQFSIRFLIKKELVEKRLEFRRERQRCVLNITEYGKDIFRRYG